MQVKHPRTHTRCTRTHTSSHGEKEVLHFFLSLARSLSYQLFLRLLKSLSFENSLRWLDPLFKTKRGRKIVKKASPVFLETLTKKKGEEKRRQKELSSSYIATYVAITEFLYATVTEWKHSMERLKPRHNIIFLSTVTKKKVQLMRQRKMPISVHHNNCQCFYEYVRTWLGGKLFGSPDSFPHEHLTVCPLTSVLWTATMACAADSFVENLKNKSNKERMFTAGWCLMRPPCA